MQNHDGELRQLQHREVLLPPEVGPHGRAEGREEVVEVHDNMDEGVEEAAEGLVSAGREAGQLPGDEGHDGVVDDVQVGDVAVLLARHEEQRVDHLGVLGDVEPPGAGEHIARVHAVGGVHRLAPEAVVAVPAAEEDPLAEPPIEQDLRRRKGD